MSFLKWLTLFVAAISVLWYRYHEPLPSCLDDLPFGIRMGLHMKPLVESLAGLVSFTGLMTKTQFQRAAARLSIKREPDTADMSSVDANFGGVNVRVYIPTKRTSHGPAAFFIHGGAWVIGDINTYDPVVRRLALELNLVTVSVDYRLAPENPFPAGLNDVETAFRHFLKHASDFDIDPSRVAVIGDSAGGNLATVLATRMRDAVEVKKEAGLPRIKLQVLIYPSSQAFEFSSISRLEHMSEFVVPRYAAIAYRLQYVLGMDFYNSTLRHLTKRYLYARCYSSSPRAELRQRVDNAYRKNPKNDDIRERIMTAEDRAFLESLRSDDIARIKYVDPKCTIESPSELKEAEQRVLPLFDPDVSPLLTPSLERLPPAFVVSAGMDGLRDDVLLYVERLRDAGVLVGHKHYANECHGFISFGKLHKVTDELRKLLADNPKLL